MFRSSFAVFFAVFVLVYLLLNFWIGLRGWQSIGRHIPFAGLKVYWAVFWMTALSYLAGRLGGEILPAGVSRLFTVAGSYWLGFMVYFVLALAVFEVLRLAGKLAGVLPGLTERNPHLAPVAGVVVLFLVCGIVAYGWWNARIPQVRRYSVNIPKQAVDLKEMRVVAVSDLHLGTIVHNGRLIKMVEMINGLQPDLVLLPGDVVDENPGPFVEQDMAVTFRRLAPKYGIYAVPGNHEYYGRKSDEIIKHLEDSGIIVLRDQTVKIADSFYLIGKDDYSRRRLDGRENTAPVDLMKDIDRSLPVILMEHQPSRAGQGPVDGVDLKISGHTHRGQLFPFNLITRQVYETDWGYLRRGGMQEIVSSGFGTWGPPIRVGSTPEIVLIDIRFSP
ncbi:MAG: metallophosphoesterase [Peptococcaceae bacterium]|nr:metallophosphoesterase [Peptococcaceae bacterium]